MAPIYHVHLTHKHRLAARTIRVECGFPGLSASGLHCPGPKDAPAPDKAGELPLPVEVSRGSRTDEAPAKVTLSISRLGSEIVDPHSGHVGELASAANCEN